MASPCCRERDDGERDGEERDDEEGRDEEEGRVVDVSAEAVVQPMPAWVKQLEAGGVVEAYAARPAYPRNDRRSWITRAKLEATQQKRAAAMVGELKEGTHAMGMR